MRKIAIIPFFGGVSDAAHSEIANRQHYLVQTMFSLHNYEMFIYVQNERDRDELKKLLHEKHPVILVNSEPKFLPLAAVQSFIETPLELDGNDIILLTEADQSYVIYDSVYKELEDNNYYSPIRMEETYEGSGTERGPCVMAHGHYLVLPNISLTDNRLAAFGGAILCKYSAFRNIKWQKSNELPVEHITGFSAYDSLKCLMGYRFMCLHLSGVEYHKKLKKN